MVKPGSIHSAMKSTKIWDFMALYFLLPFCEA
jgi:hypothetical protein